MSVLRGGTLRWCKYPVSHLLLANFCIRWWWCWWPVLMPSDLFLPTTIITVMFADLWFSVSIIPSIFVNWNSAVVRALPSSPLIYLYNSLFLQEAFMAVHCNHYLFCDPDQSDPDLTIGSLQLCPVLGNILNLKSHPAPILLLKLSNL